MPGDKVLYDCNIDTRRYPCFIKPDGGWLRPPKSLAKRAMNVDMRGSRTIIENTFGRVNGKWPILTDFKKSRRLMGPVMFVAVAFTNIDRFHNHPYRYKCCEDKSCVLCKWEQTL